MQIPATSAGNSRNHTLIAYNKNMVYFVIPVILTVYFEIFGQAVLYRLKKNPVLFSFPAGFIVWLAFAYLSTGILTAANCLFRTILIIYGLFFLATLVFIGRHLKSIPWEFNWKAWLFLVAAVVYLTSFSWRTTLGDLDGFDSLTYINLVCNNAGIGQLNTTSVLYGIESVDIILQYRFQSYYYLASVLLYVTEKICLLLHVTFYRMPAFVWTFQNLFFLMTCALLLMGVEKSAKYRVQTAVLALSAWLLFYQKMYFTSVFGFYGNTLRTTLIGFACFWLYEYFTDRQKESRWMFSLSLLASCAASSSASFITFLFLYALFFILMDMDSHLFRHYGLVLFMPAANLFAVILDNITRGCLIAAVFRLTLILMDKPLGKLFSTHRSRRILLGLTVIAMYGMSVITTGRLMDLSVFFGSTNQYYDMTLNYFLFAGQPAIKILYCMLVLTMLAGAAAVRHDSEFIMLDLILILAFFNPLCCPFLNRIASVYYRAYDIIINPFTFVLLADMCFSRIGNRRITYGIAGVLACGFLMLENPLTPNYFHSSFIPPENYSAINKMTEDEYDIIVQLDNTLRYKQQLMPKIITNNKLTQSMLNRGSYYFSRNNHIGPWTDAEKELYLIFYPNRYWVDDKLPPADYANACSYLKEAQIDYVVVNRNDLFYDTVFKGGTWLGGNYFVSNCGTYPFYENSTFSLYQY